MRRLDRVCSLALLALVAAAPPVVPPAAAQAVIPPAATSPALPSDTPARLVPVTASFDYVKREVMIPMRDGVKLHTVIIVPKGAERAPILLTRTPYNATALTSQSMVSQVSVE